MQRAQRGLQRTVAGLAAVGLLLIGLILWGLLDLRRAAWSEASSNSVNLVTALARDIDRTFQTYGLMLQAALEGVNTPGFEHLDMAVRRKIVFGAVVKAESYGSMFVLDAAGNVVCDSDIEEPRQANFADRRYFTIQRDRRDVGLYISEPTIGRFTNGWSVILSRRIDKPDGSFGGIVVGSIRYSYFDRLFANLNIGTRGAIALAGTDGRLIYRLPFSERDIGRDVSNSRVTLQAEHAASGLSVATSQLDGRRRLTAFTHVGSLPFVLAVAVAESSILAPWRMKALAAGGVSVSLLLLGGVLIHAMSQQLRRRHAAEAETARVAEMFQANFVQSADAMFLVNVREDGRLAYDRINPVAEQAVGFTSQHAYGKGPHDLYDPALAAVVEEHLLACAATGAVTTFEVRLERPDGVREMQSVLSPIHGEDGRVTQVLSCSRDMTEQNRAEGARQQAVKMEAVGRLTAGVAHDFNNYLQAITGCLEILSADYLPNADAQEVAAIAQRAAHSGAQVTHRLLAFSRQQVLQPRRVNVATLLAETRQLASAAALGPRIRTKIAVEPFTDDIIADPTQAESCLLSLLLNAAESMPDGGSLVLHARNARPKDGLFGTLLPGRHVIVAVHDTGRGMDEATRSRAFDPFFTTKTFGNGAGLGLSMAQGFCRQTGGDIRLLSGGATGTRAELWLPAASTDMLAGEETQFNLATIGRGTGRVLMVEDEPDVAVALSATLVSGGFEVVAVNNARDGLLRLRDRDPYDAVLTDYSMPDMTGIEFLVRAADIVPGMPTLMLTGFDMTDVIIPTLPRATHMLRKPIRRTALLNAVREAIGERSAAAA